MGELLTSAGAVKPRLAISFEGALHSNGDFQAGRCYLLAITLCSLLSSLQAAPGARWACEEA